jgi:hypothetical protein
MNETKITKALEQFELDNEGNLWTRPRGSRPIQADAVLVTVDGLAYRVEVADIKATQQVQEPKDESEGAE